MERVLGYAPEEVIARGSALDAPEAAHPEDVPKIVAGFAEVLTNPGVGPPAAVPFAAQGRLLAPRRGVLQQPAPRALGVQAAERAATFGLVGEV